MLEMWCPPAVFLLSQVLLAWSGGPSSSSMIWQVLEVRLHTVLLCPGHHPTELESGRPAPWGSCLELERAALEGSWMCIQEVHKPGAASGVPSCVPV